MQGFWGLGGRDRLSVRTELRGGVSGPQTRRSVMQVRKASKSPNKDAQCHM